MNCTAFGLMVAIPLVLDPLDAADEDDARSSTSLEMASVKFLNAITERAVTKTARRSRRGRGSCRARRRSRA